MYESWFKFLDCLPLKPGCLKDGPEHQNPHWPPQLSVGCRGCHLWTRTTLECLSELRHSPTSHPCQANLKNQETKEQRHKRPEPAA